jgi:hypothetical protein
MNKFNKQQSNNKIKLTESTLRNLIQESIKEALNEIGNTEASQYMLGRDASRQLNKGKDASAAFSRMSKTDKTPFGDGFNAQKRTNNGLNGLEQTGFNRYNDRNLHQLADSFYGWMFDFNDEPKQIVLDYLKYNDENSFDEIVNQYQEEIGRPLTNEETIQLTLKCNHIGRKMNIYTKTTKMNMMKNMKIGLIRHNVNMI